jgi:protein-S-isoprenylcysteine O-methyltransferase Ste14
VVGVAQSVELLVVVQAVEGSSPSTHPKASPWENPPIPDGAVERIGHICYKYRQYLSIALLVASILLARPLTADTTVNFWLDVGAFALVVAGGGVRSWAMGYHVWRRVYGPGSERRLITAGPYAFVRNPLYTGTLLISAGVALMSGSWIIIATYLVVFWLGYLAIIAWEEGKLTGEFGEEYRGYFESVPRLIPGFKVWHDRRGTFSFPTMMRCMEPVKTLAFLAAQTLMLYLKT